MGHINKSVLIADKSEETITIRDIMENGVRTLSIEENGKIYFQQSTAFECIPNGAKTFLDEFLNRLNTCCDKPDESKRLKFLCCEKTKGVKPVEAIIIVGSNVILSYLFQKHRKNNSLLK